MINISMAWHQAEDLIKCLIVFINLFQSFGWEELKEKNERQVLDTIKIKVKKFCEELDIGDSECQFNIEDIIVRIGHPGNEILTHANEVPYDMVVIGTRGLGMFAEVIMGSTARKVVRRCNKPVLTIRLP